ncbi:hypothetical protein N9165_03305 [Akkermansiaceae bacterium]|nr:hypothetical protein [Akkermansiaceae bacterium]
MLRLLLLIQLIASAAMTGIIWIVQVAVYPLFAKVGAEAFNVYHEDYMFLVSFVIMPLMAIEALTCAACFFWGNNRDFLAPSILFGMICLSTALIQVPHHQALTQAAVGGLVAGNWVRTIAWTLRTGLLARLVLKTPTSEID